MRSHRLLASAIVVSSTVIGCTADHLPRAATTQPSANVWRPYTSGEFRYFESAESAAKHSIRPSSPTSTNQTAQPTLHGERVVSTTARVFEGDQFSVNYVVNFELRDTRSVQLLESTAQYLLAQVDRLADRSTGLNEASVDLSATGRYSAGSFIVTRGAAVGADDEVRFMPPGDNESDHDPTIVMPAKAFRAALVASLQDIEKLKRLPIIAP